MKEASNTMSTVPTKDFSATKVVDMIKTEKISLIRYITTVNSKAQISEESSQPKKRNRRSAVTKMSTYFIYDDCAFEQAVGLITNLVPRVLSLPRERGPWERGCLITSTNT